MGALKYRKFIKVNNDSQVYFGGNQTWWRNQDEAMSSYGCGIIAMCNLELYVDGVGIKGISYDDYIAYVEKRRKEIYSLHERSKLQRLGLMPSIMERGIDRFYNSKGIDPIVSWCPTINKRKIRMLIDNMLDNNVPVVASYYVFNKKQKLDLYTYNEKTRGFDRAAEISRHYFNIVGITRRYGKDMLVISTWGQKYYAFYEQWVRKLSIFSNILYVE